MMAAVDKGEADGLGTAFAKKFSQTNFGSVPRAVKPAAEACLQVGLHGRATLSERIKSHMFEVVAGRMPRADDCRGRRAHSETRFNREARGRAAREPRQQRCFSRREHNIQ